MLIEADLVPEGLVADVASEGPLPVVRATGVHLQPVRSREHLLAFNTREGVAADTQDASCASHAAHAAAGPADTAASATVVVVAIQRFQLMLMR